MIVVAYIKAMKLEANLSTQYRKDLILLLSKFSAYMSKYSEAIDEKQQKESEVKELRVRTRLVSYAARNGEQI